MPETPVKLHMGPQEAASLLDPIRLELTRLETRLARFVERAELTEADIATLVGARTSIAGATAEISRLQTEAKA
ncbi:MAG: hypothetical protein ACRDHN_00165 [Thermomicrobiales bacterium]